MGRRRIILSGLGSAQFNRVGCTLLGKHIIAFCIAHHCKWGLCQVSLRSGMAPRTKPRRGPGDLPPRGGLGARRPGAPGICREGVARLLLQIPPRGDAPALAPGPLDTARIRHLPREKDAPAWEELNNVLVHGLEMEVFAYDGVIGNRGQPVAANGMCAATVLARAD